MNARRTMTCVALLAGLGLTGCGSPSDMPTAVDTGSVRVAAQSTPTLVPTILPSATSAATIAPPPTAAPSATSAPTTIPTVAATPSASPSASPAPSDDASDDGHPIAQVIADEFGVSVAEVEGYHAQGIGYGVLAQFYSIAYQRCAAQTSYTVDQLVAMKLGGMGMGEIRKQALGSAAANECSLGRLKQEDLDAADNAQAGPPDDKGNNGNNGNSGNDDKGKADDKGNNGNDDKGKADDKGNNGNSGGKGNGGNSGGKGNGGGKGKGK